MQTYEHCSFDLDIQSLENTETWHQQTPCSSSSSNQRVQRGLSCRETVLLQLKQACSYIPTKLMVICCKTNSKSYQHIAGYSSSSSQKLPLKLELQTFMKGTGPFTSSFDHEVHEYIDQWSHDQAPQHTFQSLLFLWQGRRHLQVACMTYV